MEEEVVKVTCIQNGPARIQGSFELVMPDGQVVQQEGTLAICRCGQSSKMPLCDGSHKNSIPGHDGTS
ncbi:MAG: CDGSH iron-sulfur domain-containing protein [Saprospiraceae bacterium]|nr:CDGSH iron-sulfur domain-containing protein [Saprospiraceae bacterium]